MAQYLTLSTTLRSRSPENSYHGSLPEIISNPFNYYCGSAALVWILVEVEVCMVHRSLTRSDWYSLFLANRKWEKGIHCPQAWKGIVGIHCPHWQGMGMHSHNWQRVSHWYCCSTSSISQSSATSGSLATGTGGVVGLAAEGVDGGVNEVGIPGTLVSPGRGNSRYIYIGKNWN